MVRLILNPKNLKKMNEKSKRTSLAKRELPEVSGSEDRSSEGF